MTEQAHPDCEIMERYAMGKLSSREAEAVEEHLLLCEHCQDALQDFDDMRRAMRCVAAEPRSQSWWERFRARVLSLPKWSPVPAAAMAAAAVMLMVSGPRPVPVKGVAPVSLSAMRGDDGIASVPANHQLELDLNATALPGDAFRVEVVTASGSQLWSHSGVRLEGQRLRVRTSVALEAGLHWVRIYSPSGALLREFGLRAR